MSKLNEQQQAAVKARESKILVSASAGTGKTTVLADRVLSLLKEDKVDINQLLILTFTKNAAEHMRDKLEERISEDPDLSAAEKARQLELLEEADITTISAYAEKIVKDYYYQLKIDPDFNLLSEDVAKNSLRSEVWDDVIADIYHNDDDNPMTAGVKNLLYLLTDGANDYSLRDSIFGLYDFLSSLKDPQEWKHAQLQSIKKPFEESEYFTRVVDHIKTHQNQIKEINELFDDYQKRYDEYQAYLTAHDLEDQAKLAMRKDNNLAYIKTLKPFLNAFNGVKLSWDNLKSVVAQGTHNTNQTLVISNSYKGIPNLKNYASLSDNVTFIKSFNSIIKKIRDALKCATETKRKEKLTAIQEDYRDIIAQFEKQKENYFKIADSINNYYAHFEANPDKSVKNFLGNKELLINGYRTWYKNCASLAVEAFNKYINDASDTEACQESYVAIKEAVDNYKVSVAKIDDKLFNDIDYVLDISEQLRSEHKDFLDSLIVMLPANIEEQYRQQQAMIPAFLDLYETFTKAYDARKDEIALYEFSDIERKALDLINNNEVVRKELNDSYQEIIVDEYQDTNELQETILEQIAGDNTRRFMVGDVKQSIYKFRHADHMLFMDKEEKFGSEQAPDAAVIRLNTNYRSRQGVTSPINDVFNVVMDGENQELNYQGQELVAGNPNYNAYHDDNPEEVPEFENSLEPFKFYKITLENGADKYDTEAAYVVDKIKTILTEKKQIIDRNTGKARIIKPSDIAIISRSWTHNDVYLNELKKAGISYKVARSDLFLEQFEIHVALAYLRILDNSRQDISLVAVLHSPIYRINDQELAFLRVLQERGSFYGTLFGFMNRYKDDQEVLLKEARDLDVADNPEEFLDVLHAKIENFLSDYNKLAALHTVSSLTDTMQAILSLTDIIPAFTALPQGQARRFNLNGLVQYISSFEGSGIATVDNLVKSLEHEKLTSINPDIDDSSLTYTTIHSSKGLEYPVVFLVNAENPFSNQDIRGTVIWDKDDLDIASISKEMLDEDLDIFSLNNDSTILKLLKDKLKQSNISEEKRLLYVAMTRAEQALYVVAAGKDNLEKKKGNNYLSMLNSSLDDKYIELINKYTPEVDDSDNQDGSEIFMKSNFSLPVEEETPKVISTRYATTNKELKGSIKNRDFAKEERLKASSYQGQDYSQEKASETVKADVLGTAAHLVFEKHLDKEHYPSTDVRETIKQLEAEELIPTEAADELLENFVAGIQAFFDTGKGADMLKLAPAKVHPEYEFTALVKTQETFETADEDYTVVHGFIDCFYETDDDKVIIVDYKTDIRLTDDKVLAENYDGQLRLYTQALQAMGKKVEAAYVYGIRHQDIFEINIDDLK
ncbi:UvrD-helicase domain-containing protein [Ligilactobacillus equi]|uniref:UvrD-helicase domain-containing protein n=1 Tax=Ligilactobacillus equi TaxID=137357 RepID=UPI002ED43101